MGRTPASRRTRVWRSRSITPTRPTKSTDVPSVASQVAVFAAEPPPRRSMVEGVSVSGRMAPLGVAMMSSITSPKTTIRAPPSVIEPRPFDRNFPRHTHIIACEIQIDLEAAALGCLHNEAEEERGHCLTVNSRLFGRDERLRQDAVVLGRIPLLLPGDRVCDDDALAMTELILRTHDGGDL